jgi:hypothetical protein
MYRCVVTLTLTDVSEVRTTSETSVNFNVTIRCYIVEDSKLQNCISDKFNHVFHKYGCRHDVSFKNTIFLSSLCHPLRHKYEYCLHFVSFSFHMF